MATPQSWYRGGYMVSTAPQLIQVAAVNEAFGSEEMYWAKKMDMQVLRKMLDKSLCFGVYQLPESSAQLAGRANPTQVGLARLITDEVSFAYITDVYVLPSHQGKGLGKWLMECVNEELSKWPELRRSLLMSNHEGCKFYASVMRMEPFEQGKGGYSLLNRKWGGSGIDA